MPPREITPFQFLGGKPVTGGHVRNPDDIIVTTFDASKEEVEHSRTLHPSFGETGDLAGTANTGHETETVAVRPATAMEVDQTEAKADLAAAVENGDVVVVLPPDTTTKKAPKGAPASG